MPGRDESTLARERAEPRLDVVEVLDDGSCGRCVSRSGRVRSARAAPSATDGAGRITQATSRSNTRSCESENFQTRSTLNSPPTSVECLAKLRAAGCEAEPAKPAAGRSECSVPEPVAVKRLRVRDKVIEFPDEPILDCRFADRLGQWASDLAIPVVFGGLGPG